MWSCVENCHFPLLAQAPTPSPIVQWCGCGDLGRTSPFEKSVTKRNDILFDVNSDQPKSADRCHLKIQHEQRKRFIIGQWGGPFFAHFLTGLGHYRTCPQVSHTSLLFRGAYCKVHFSFQNFFDPVRSVVYFDAWKYDAAHLKILLHSCILKGQSLSGSTARTFANFHAASRQCIAWKPKGKSKEKSKGNQTGNLETKNARNFSKSQNRRPVHSTIRRSTIRNWPKHYSMRQVVDRRVVYY